MSMRFVPMIALAAGMCLAPAAPCAELLLDLRAEVLVTGPQVRLSDLATVSSADARLQQAVAALPLGRAPLAGYLDHRSRAELEAALRSQVGMLGHELVWRGATGVQIRSESHPVPGTELAQAARRYLLDEFGSHYALLEVNPAAAVPDLLVPAGQVTLRVRPLERRQLRSRMAVWVDVLVDETVYRSAVLPMVVVAQRPVYVASHALPHDSVPGADDFTTSLRDVAGMADEPVDAIAPGARLRQDVAAGQVLARKQLAAPDMVLHGDRVRLLAGGHGIAIETSAVAETSAGVGQLVRVQAGRGETVMARVTAPGVVRLEER